MQIIIAAIKEGGTFTDFREIWCTLHALKAVKRIFSVSTNTMQSTRGHN
jgi:hypothetical protein